VNRLGDLEKPGDLAGETTEASIASTSEPQQRNIVKHPGDKLEKCLTSVLSSLRQQDSIHTRRANLMLEGKRTEWQIRIKN